MLQVLAGCGSDDAEAGPPECVTVNLDCAPLYQPTFDEVFARTLESSCASGGGSCHGSSGKRGGLTLTDVDEAHAALVSGGRVLPGDAACSELVVRLEGAGESWSMPPGRQLSEAERCAIRQWVDRGAAR